MNRTKFCEMHGHDVVYLLADEKAEHYALMLDGAVVTTFLVPQDQLNAILRFSSTVEDRGVDLRLELVKACAWAAISAMADIHAGRDTSELRALYLATQYVTGNAVHVDGTPITESERA